VRLVREPYLLHWPDGHTTRMAGLSVQDCRARLQRTWAPIDVSAVQIERDPEPDRRRQELEIRRRA
jgi:hypothetical protein